MLIDILLAVLEHYSSKAKALYMFASVEGLKRDVYLVFELLLIIILPVISRGVMGHKELSSVFIWGFTVTV